MQEKKKEEKAARSNWTTFQCIKPAKGNNRHQDTQEVWGEKEKGGRIEVSHRTIKRITLETQHRQQTIGKKRR